VLIGQDPGLRANQSETVANSVVAPSTLVVQYLSGAAHSRFFANLKYHSTKLHDVTQEEINLHIYLLDKFINKYIHMHIHTYTYTHIHICIHT